VFENPMIDVNTLIPMLGVKPISLPYVDGAQSDKGKDNHGNKASQLAQDDGKKDETEKGYTYGNGGKG
jgi:hypothetical protein